MNGDDRVARVLATVDAIPRGRVATYGDVAREAGLPGRARWVGSLLKGLPKGSELAWHRVLAASGKLVSPSRREQARRLRAEGVAVRADRVDLARHRWPAPE